MSQLLVPSSRSGIHGATEMVTSDLYHIAERIKEVDPNLSLVFQKGHERPWVVMEAGRDGVERFVSRYSRADATILENLRYMLNVPFEKRIAELEKKIEAENRAKEQFPEDKFEEFAYDMHKAMVESNMISPKWGRSYRPKVKK